MNQQVKAWQREYRAKGPARIESSVTLRPEPSVLWFYGQMHRRGLRPGILLDLGCGRGRNSMVFLKKGWRVEGLDAVRGALRDFKILAGKKSDHLGLHCRNFQSPLPFPNQHFDAVMEVTAADNLADLRVRGRFWREVVRVLKPGGWFFTYHFTTRDGYYGPLLRKSPARSRGLLYDARARMTFRFYDVEEIVKSTRGRLRPAASRNYRYPGPMFGKRFVRDLRAALFQKKEA